MEQNVRESQFLWSLIKYKPILYTVIILMEFVIGSIPIIEGILIKEFFDVIGGKSTSIFGVYELIGLMGVVACVHIFIMWVYFSKTATHGFYINTLLKRNMLSSILKKHGRKAIETPVGEVLNSFRDDVSQIGTCISWLPTIIGQIVRALGAIVILFLIDDKITVFVFIPLVIVILLAQKSEKNIEKNREEGRKATGTVNAAIGEILVICGRTGSGKSTLIKSLIGLLPMDSGEVYWNGEQVNDVKHFVSPPISAYNAQVPNLFSDTVKNNILLGLREEEVDLEAAIKSAVLEKDIAKLENGLDTMIGSKGTKLSGGQIQRVAAARTFVRDPQLLVFDDISSALDIKTETLLWTRLIANNKASCVIVSNKRMILEKADQIIVLKDGVIEAQGILDEVLQTSSEIKYIID